MVNLGLTRYMYSKYHNYNYKAALLVQVINILLITTINVGTIYKCIHN